MKTAEEIFNEYSWEELQSISPSKSFCLKAMKAYAIEAIKADREKIVTRVSITKTDGGALMCPIDEYLLIPAPSILNAPLPELL